MSEQAGEFQMTARESLAHAIAFLRKVPMKKLPYLLAMAVTAFASCNALAEVRPDNEIPPEGYFEASGRLILPLRKVVGGIKLVASDMGSTFAGCPNARPRLNELRALVDLEYIATLAERGVSREAYSTLWNEAYRSGQSRPASAADCAMEEQSWQRMIERIKSEQP